MAVSVEHLGMSDVTSLNIDRRSAASTIMSHVTSLNIDRRSDSSTKLDIENVGRALIPLMHVSRVRLQLRLKIASNAVAGSPLHCLPWVAGRRGEYPINPFSPILLFSYPISLQQEVGHEIVSKTTF